LASLPTAVKGDILIVFGQRSVKVRPPIPRARAAAWRR